MTPKTDIIWLDIDEPIQSIKTKIIKSSRTVFPLCKNNLDNFLGLIRLKDIYSVDFQNGAELKNYLKKPLVVPESSDALDLLKLFKESEENVHIALVIDEYGNLVGLISLYDILEAIVGNIPKIKWMKKRS